MIERQLILELLDGSQTEYIIRDHGNNFKKALICILSASYGGAVYSNKGNSAMVEQFIVTSIGTLFYADDMYFKDDPGDRLDAWISFGFKYESWCVVYYPSIEIDNDEEYQKNIETMRSKLGGKYFEQNLGDNDEDGLVWYFSDLNMFLDFFYKNIKSKLG